MRASSSTSSTRCWTKDLRHSGYLSWTAFAAEFSPWRGNRTRAYLRFIESDLDQIKEAVCRGDLTLTVATRAPGEVGSTATPEAQARWIREARLEEIPRRHRAFMDVLTGDDMRRVLDAREIGAILIGKDATVLEVDNFVMACHEQKLTNEQILERARAVPPRPPRLGRKAPDWKHDPDESVLGPWVEPKGLDEAIARLREFAVVQDTRRVLLGMAYFLMRDHALWTAIPDCGSLPDLCLRLGISQRTFQRYAREGWVHYLHPSVRKDVVDGRLTADRAFFAMEGAGGCVRHLAAWIELAQRLGRVELRRASERTGNARQDYAHVVALANSVEAILRQKANGQATETASAESGGQATETAGEAEQIAEHLRKVGVKGRIGVALRNDRNRQSTNRVPQSILVPPKLLAAANYLLATVVLPKSHGPRKMVVHDAYTCQNPRCGRRSLRNHPHHQVFRQHGGTDEPTNIVTQCPCCHLFGIHSGNLGVVRIGATLVWSYPDGTADLMESPVEELVYGAY